MSTRLQVLEMLVQGLTPVQVSTTLGISDGYVSQLVNEEDFAAELEAKKVAVAKEDLEYDEQLDRVEHTFLDRIETKAPLANLQQSLQAFAVLNKAKRRKDSAVVRNAPIAGTIVNLQLNVNLIPQYLVNGKNEIVEVEGKSMISATPRKLDQILAIRRGEELNAPKVPALPGITRVERAAVVLEAIDNKPRRKMPKMLPSDMAVSDLL